MLDNRKNRNSPCCRTEKIQFSDYTMCVRVCVYMNYGCMSIDKTNFRKEKTSMKNKFAIKHIQLKIIPGTENFNDKFSQSIVNLHYSYGY